MTPSHLWGADIYFFFSLFSYSLPSTGADVINFDGQGVISYRFKMKKMKILKDVIALKFKTSESEGVILHGEGQQGDYITLELRRGRLLIQINLGNA